MSTWLVALVAFIAAVIGSSEASCPAKGSTPAATIAKASCATYQKDLPDGSLAFCNGIVNYPFYLPSDTSQAQLDALAQSQLINGNPAASLLLTILPPRCSFQLKKTVCLAVFQACEYVDPYFVDSTCGSTAICSTCGSVAGTPALIVASSTPSYASVCRKLSDMSIVSATGSNFCVVGPGKVPGLGNLGWETAQVAFAPSATISQFCQQYNLTWVENSKSCMAAIPRSACKSVCNQVWNMDKTIVLGSDGIPQLTAVCPLVSGNWTERLQTLAASDADPYVRQQAQSALDASVSGRTSISLLAAFGLGPACNALAPAPSNAYAFSENLTQEFPPDRSISVGLVIKGKATLYNTIAPNQCHCVNNLASFAGESTNNFCDPTAASTCSNLMSRTSLCNANSGSLAPNPTVKFAGINADGMSSACKDVVRSSNNQPPSSTLELIAAGYGLTTDQAKGAFFVGPSPGLPVLAAGNMSRPLCEIPNNNGNGEIFRGYDSYECAVAAVKSAERIIPGFLGGQCRIAFLDLLCNTAHMKLDFKSMCLLPNGEACSTSDVAGAATNKIPFNYALPRFPSRFLCENFKSQCAGFLASLGAQGTLIGSAFDCSGNVQQTCARNNPLSQWSSSVWSCTSSFNVLPAYPPKTQAFTNIPDLLGSYPLVNNLSALGLLGTSTVANRSISDGTVAASSVCECPYPLVVPDDPTAPGLTPSVCCNLRCEGHMYNPADFNSIVLVQKIASILSIIGTTFIIATWGVFKVKRSQPLTFFFAISSFNISLTFIIPVYYKSDVREVWCRDNTQANVQGDGGMCLFQSVYLTFWVICACTFWLVQGFDLFLRIVHNQRHLEHLTKWYHLFAWGLPILIIAIMLGENALGYETNFFWCFLRDISENQSLNIGLDLGLFYGTIIAIWFVGSSLMIVVLYRIWKITSKTSGTAQMSNTALKRLAMYRTPVFFVVFFVYVWASIFAWRFTAEAKKEPIKESIEDWASCLLTNFGAGIYDAAFSTSANNSVLAKYGKAPGTGCGDVYPVGIQYSDYVYLMCITNLQGVFIFFIFGAKLENINLWKEKLGLTTKKYDTTADDSSSKDKSNKPSLLSNAMSSLFAPSSPKLANDSTEKDGGGGGSAVMVSGLQSGKFMAVTEPEMHGAKIKNNQVAAAYMSE